MLHFTTYKCKTEPENHSSWVVFVHGAGGSSAIWYKQIKAFNTKHHVLLLDLRGHGENKEEKPSSQYTFNSITNDIIEVLDFLSIKSAHFIGISLGTILIRNLAEHQPHRITSMVLGGAILKLNFRSQLLMHIGMALKSVVPYMVLYKLFAYIIMPKKNHKRSRLLFVNEAKKLYQSEFIKWFKMASEVNPLLRKFRKNDICIPTLYIMGEEDYLFLPVIKKLVKKHKSATLSVLNSCGHVVNLEKTEQFNSTSIAFISKHDVL